MRIKGIGLKPIRKVATGGELSSLMLMHKIAGARIT